MSGRRPDGAGRSGPRPRSCTLTSRPLLTEAELIAWGERVGAEVEPPLVLALRGDLGAGKSTLARAIARGAGVEGPLPSPTFNLLFRYATPGGAQLVHIDLYRLDDPAEVWALGWAELPADDEIVMIEWPERAEALLPEPRWEVELREEDDPERRSVCLTRIGAAASIPSPGADR